MGQRLSRIYTRTGDDGTTVLGDGSRVDKDHPRVEALGAVDELNSAIALALVQPMPDPVRSCLMQVQNELFDLGGELSIPGQQRLGPDYVAGVERWLDRFNADLPPLREFVLPGGGPAAAACHLARTFSRRTERRVVTLLRIEPINDNVLAYLNRLSDLLFVISRVLARAESGAEVLWEPGRR